MLPSIGKAANRTVDPRKISRGRSERFHDKLIIHQFITNEVRDRVIRDRINLEVHRLSNAMLRIKRTAYSLIQPRRTESRMDHDIRSKLLIDWIQDRRRQARKIFRRRLRWGIANAALSSYTRLSELIEREVFRYQHNFLHEPQ